MDSVIKEGFTDIEALYREKIEPHLRSLQDQRQKLRIDIYSIVVGVVLIGLLVWLMDTTGSGLLVVPLIAVIIGLIVFGVRVYYKKIAYRSAFKETVVAKIVESINADWEYYPDGMISKSVYNASDIFRKRCDRYKGDDLVKGMLDKTDFECSELHTQYQEVTTDSKGRTSKRWVTIFKGLFFHADFNKEFIGRTYVSPDIAERFFGRMGRKFQKISGPAPLVVLENIEFEKAFVVHSTDQIEARYILTPAIMEAMLNIKNRYNCSVHFSFIGSRVYCALSMKRNLFEPKFFGPVVNLQEIEDMHRLFKVNEIIIHELNLNTRIWTK